MLLMTWLNKGEVKMRLEFAVVIGIVLLMHSIYWGIFWTTKTTTVENDPGIGDFLIGAIAYPLATVISSIPTFIVVGLLYWWLYAF